uniref:Uncharacterized protein n=1 Tax=Siphoviridae sp. ctTDf8 TaxID=2825517 RepID=A0A8S5UJ18_9CAUD|nr:MAG TPA: hypothetical protein [Siphoviridae sp. ctTDf8]
MVQAASRMRSRGARLIGNIWRRWAVKTNLKYAADRMMPAGAKDMVKAYVDEEFAKRQKIYTRRILLALCIVLNDLFHFGNKRLMWVLKGIEDVMCDYASRIPKDYRAESPEDDELSRIMQEELNSRKGLSVEIK